MYFATFHISLVFGFLQCVWYGLSVLFFVHVLLEICWATWIPLPIFHCLQLFVLNIFVQVYNCFWERNHLIFLPLLAVFHFYQFLCDPSYFFNIVVIFLVVFLPHIKFVINLFSLGHLTFFFLHSWDNFCLFLSLFSWVWLILWFFSLFCSYSFLLLVFKLIIDCF